MAGPLKKYRFINAKLRARLSKILSDEFLEQLIRSASLPETVQLLMNTEYSIVETVYNKTGDLKMVELELFKNEVFLYKELEKYVSGEVLTIIQALATRFETETLKNTLRLWFDRNIRKRNIDNAMGYLFRNKIHYNLNIDELIKAPELTDVADALSGTPYQQIIRDKSPSVEKRKSIFELEIAIDHYYYRQLLEAVSGLKKRDRDMADRLIGVAIDMQNINWIVRFKMSYNLPIGEAVGYCIPAGFNLDQRTLNEAYSGENVTEILSGLIHKKYPGLRTLLTKKSQDTYARLLLVERILGQIINVEINKVLVGYPFTIGIILAYFILKGNELKKIMTILNAKYYGINAERIQSGL